MTEISVQYVSHMGDDLLIANAARVSFGKWKEELDDGDVRLLRYLASHEHTSPFRHTSIMLRCKVPVFLARQLAKHQAGFSWNEISRRYVDSGFEFYYPRTWHTRPEGNIKQGSGEELCVDDQNFCDELLVDLTVYAEQTYRRLLRCGVAPEEARMVLPQNMMVEYVWTGNLLSWFHLYRLRSNTGAQLIAQEFAELVNAEVSKLFPHAWNILIQEIK